MKEARNDGNSSPGGDAVLPRPMFREMTVIAQDPSIRTVVGRKDAPILMAKISVPAEDLIAGPTGYRVQVVDYDSATASFNGAHILPVSLDAEPAHWKAGDPRIVDDLRFHSQNVYALVMKTLSRFEFALGRRVGWSFRTHQLKVAPHGMLDANAFYSPGDEGLVFGYFPGSKAKRVYTCLSHDVVVHETTHALIDALRERYLDPSSPDQAAFHEGLSDVIALLSVFSQPEVLHRFLVPPRRGARATTVPETIARDRVDAAALRESALFGLAKEMGEEVTGVRGAALRSSVGLKPDPHILERAEYLEPHRRGEVLVAAVLRGFVDAWAARIASAGTPGQERFAVRRVAEEGADIADALVTMWIRALDYMPPVHITFNDALSAALTADLEVRPDDTRYELRKHMLESFRAFGMLPASNASAEPGTWERAPSGLDFDRVRFESMRSDADEVFRFLWENRDRLGLRREAYTRVLSVRPCVRIGVDGFTLRETVAEYYQVARLTPPELKQAGIVVPPSYLDALRSARRAKLSADADSEDADVSTTPLYGGGVLIFDEYGRLKYHVRNGVLDKARQSARLEYLWETGQLEPGKDGSRLRVSRLSMIHRMRALDARRFPTRGW